MAEKNKTPAGPGDLQVVTKGLFEETLEPRSRLRVSFAREAGGVVLDTHLIRHRDNKFAVYALPDLKVAPGGLAQISFATSKSLYSFVTKLVRAEVVDERRRRAIFLFARPRAWRRVQRRDNFRVDMRVPVQLTRLDGAGEVFGGDSGNISASGVLVILEEKLEMDQMFELVFTLPEEAEDPDPMRLQAKVSRIRPIMIKGEKEVYHHGFEFVDLSTTDQDRLAQSLWSLLKGRAVK